MELNGNAVTLLGKASNIDAKTLGYTEIYQVPAGRSMIPVMVVVQCIKISGTKTINATAGFGISTSPSNYLDATTYPFTISNVFMTNRATNVIEKSIVPAGSSWGINITVGSDAAEETWNVYLFGYLI